MTACWWYWDSMQNGEQGQWWKADTEAPPSVYPLPQEPLDPRSHASGCMAQATRQWMRRDVQSGGLAQSPGKDRRPPPHPLLPRWLM